MRERRGREEPYAGDAADLQESSSIEHNRLPSAIIAREGARRLDKKRCSGSRQLRPEIRCVAVSLNALIESSNDIAVVWPSPLRRWRSEEHTSELQSRFG